MRGVWRCWSSRLERVLVAMVADPGRRLSSIDVLDEREHVRLGEFGNRAVLAEPAVGRVDSGAVCGAGGSDAGGGGDQLCGSGR